MLPERLAKLRSAKKVTHQKIAEMLGISRQGYSNYESGKRDVDTETLIKLADILETNTDYLLGRTEDPRPTGNIPNDDTVEDISPSIIKQLKEIAKKYNYDFNDPRFIELINISLEIREKLKMSNL